MKFLPFTESKEYVHSLQLKNVKEWELYCKSGKKPEDIPANPGRVYDEWKNWRDYIREAKRCLATNGYLLIAETTKSLNENGRLSALRDLLKEEGFEMYQDEERGDFTFIEAREL